MALLAPNIEPYLDRPTSPEGAIERAIEQGDDLERTLLQDAQLAGIEAQRLEFTGCRFVKCSLAYFEVKRLSFTDCRFENCDFSNLDLSGCAMVRCEVEGSKLTGATFSDATLAHTRFTDCQMGYLAIGKSKLKWVRFEKCDLQNASLRSVKHENLTLSLCKLNASEWVDTPLKGLDLSDSEIHGILASEGAWRGAVVDVQQLPELALLLGVKIK